MAWSIALRQFYGKRKEKGLQLFGGDWSDQSSFELADELGILNGHQIGRKQQNTIFRIE